MSKHCGKREREIKCNCGCNCDCDCDCYQPHPPNCQMVLESFHKSIFKAFELFGESAKFESRSLHEARESLEALKKSIYKDNEGEKIFEHALCELDHSGCSGECNKNSCKCKDLEKKVTHYFDMSDKLKNEAACLLEEVIEKLQESIEAQEKAIEVAQDYSKCVHNKKPCNH